MVRKGIGYNPTLLNQNLNTNQDNSPWWMNANRSRYPSPIMPPMLDQTGQMGASNYQAPPPATVYPQGDDLDANWANESMVQAPEKTGILQNIKNWGGNILDNTIMGRIAGGFDATNKRAFNYNPELQGQIDFLKRNKAYGTDQSGLNKITHGALADKNLQSMFGSNDLQAMYENQLGKYQKTYDDMDDEAKKLRYYNKFIKPARIEQKKALEAQQQAAEARAVTERQAGATANQMTQRREGRGGTHMSRSRDQGGLGISQAQAQQVSDANRAAGMGGWGLAHGGRAGYNRGRVVNPGGYAGEEEFEDENILEFMRDQGVPHSEMAEGPSPFDIRVQELVDEGMSWQQAWSIASQEFGLLAEGEDSFSEEGIASIV